MKRFLIGFAFCFLQLAAFSFCSGDEPVPAHFTEWKAETIVDKSEIDRTGLDAWFKSEEISDDVFDRMWLKSWKEDCPLDRSDLRYLKVLHRNADGLPQCGEMVVNAAIADKVLGIFRQLYEAGYRIERMALIDNYGANDETAMRRPLKYPNMALGLPSTSTRFTIHTSSEKTTVLGTLSLPLPNRMLSTARVEPTSRIK